MINFAVKLAATVAIEALQVGLQASQRTKGPRLDELTLSTAEYGTPLARFLGERRFACQVFHAEDLKEVQKTSKVKGGGKQTSYHYLATFACAIADNAIDTVLKIFFDDKLVYDATGAGPISYASSLGVDLNSVMRIYLGTEDQMPDPRYSSWCEDKYGPDSAPAYRGVSYLFFEELPVDNFGNRIPQISVVAVSSAAAGYPWELIELPGGLGGRAFSADRTSLYLASGTSFQVVDLPSRVLTLQGTLDPGIDGSMSYAVTPTGIYALSSLGNAIYTIGFDGGQTNLGATFDAVGWLGGCAYAGGRILLYPSSFTGQRIGEFSGTAVTSVATNHWPTHYFTDADGIAVSVGYRTGEDVLAVAPALGDATLIDTSAYGSNGEAYGFDNGLGQYVIRQGLHRFLIDKATLTIAAHAVDALLAPNLLESFSSIRIGATTFWNGVTEYRSSDLSVVRTVDPTDWPVALPGADFETTAAVYDEVNHALFGVFNGAEGGLTWRYLDRAGNAGVTLGAIVARMCDAAGLTERDTSLLTQTVAGYSWTRGDVKSQMEPVLDIHDVDARGHDFSVQFLPRGSAPSGTVLTQDFAKSGQDSPRYKVTIEQDTDLPRILRVNFADTGFDQQTNNVLSPAARRQRRHAARRGR
jgi:hypothetical protein